MSTKGKSGVKVPKGAKKPAAGAVMPVLERAAAKRPAPHPEPDLAHIAPGLRPLAVPLSDLTPDPANVRRHGERNIAAIRSSLKRFGQQKPIVATEAGVVMAGNGFLEAARGLGWTHAAVVRTSLSGAELTAFAIADNRTAELAKWDDDALLAQLNAIGEVTLLEAAGFTPGELEKLAGSREVKEDAAPAPAPVPVSRPGDVWLMSATEDPEMGHRLMCGDSTDGVQVGNLMAGAKANLCATDPPYLVNYTGERVNDSGKDWSASYREFDIVNAEEFFTRTFRNILNVLAEHSAIYCWHAHRRVGMIQRVWAELGILDHQQIVWIKPTSVFGACMYHFQHEPCMMGWREKSKPKLDGRHNVTSVWVLPSDVRAAVQLDQNSDVWSADWDGKARPVGNEHPTEKPVEIFARPMRKHTEPMDIVFEPFSGSGSQLSAAEQLGRRCYAMELSPIFVDVGVRRWQRLTGKEAVLEGDGRTWREIAEERGVQVPVEKA